MAHLISHASRGQNKQRLDTLVVQRGLVESREQAKRLILAGEVIVSGNAQVKPGTSDFTGCRNRSETAAHGMSAGVGLKLEKALQVFQVDVAW